MPYDLDRLQADIAQIQHDAAGFGTGRLVAENLILTAAHILWRSDEEMKQGVTPPLDNWQVRFANDFAQDQWPFRPSNRVVWYNAKNDLALIQLSDSQGHPLQPIRRPALRLRVATVKGTNRHPVEARGYPRAAKEKSQRYRDLVSAAGLLSAAYAQRPLTFGIEAYDLPNDPTGGWPGMSGSAVMLRDPTDPDEIWIYGVVQEIPASFDRQLHVARLAPAWQGDSNFRALLVSAGAPNEDADDPTEKLIVTPDFLLKIQDLSTVVSQHPERREETGTTSGYDRWSKGPSADGQLSQSAAALQSRLEKLWIQDFLNPRLIDQEFIQLPARGRDDLLVRPDGAIRSEALSLSPSNAPLGDFASLVSLSTQFVTVLGEPGAGKTMVMLTIMKYSLEQLKKAGTKNTRFPLFFDVGNWEEKIWGLKLLMKLSNFTRRKSTDDPASTNFGQWLVRQTEHNFSVRQSHIAEWLSDGNVDLFLDGVDEIPAYRRDKAVEDLREFQAQFLGRVFISCRTTEYLRLREPPRADSILELLPLTDDQVDAILKKRGLHDLVDLLAKDSDLCALSRSPLMLSVMLAIQRTRADVLGESQNNVTKLFDDYTEVALSHRRLTDQLQCQHVLTALGAMGKILSKTSEKILYKSDLSYEVLSHPWQRSAFLAPIILIVFGVPAMTTIGWGFPWSLGKDEGGIVGALGCTFAETMGVFAFLIIPCTIIYDRFSLSLKGSLRGLTVGGLLALASLVFLPFTVVATYLSLHLLFWAGGHTFLLLMAGWLGTQLARVEVTAIRVLSIPFSLIMGCIGLAFAGSAYLAAMNWIVYGHLDVPELQDIFDLVNPFTRGFGFVNPTAWSIVLGVYDVVVTVYSTWLLWTIAIFLVSGAALGSVRIDRIGRTRQGEHAVPRMIFFSAVIAIYLSGWAMAILSGARSMTGASNQEAVTQSVILIMGFVIFWIMGGVRLYSYYFLLFVARIGGSIPPAVWSMLDQAAHAGLILKVGGGYAFIHDLERRYFAEKPARTKTLRES